MDNLIFKNERFVASSLPKLEMSNIIPLGSKRKETATLEPEKHRFSLEEYTNIEGHTQFWRMLKGRAQKANFSFQRMYYTEGQLWR